MDPLTNPLFIGSNNDVGIVSVPTYSTSTAQTITVPSGVINRDVLLLVDSCARSSSNGVAPTNVVPSGFTQIVSAASAGNLTTSQRNTVTYKIANGTESGTTVTGMTDSGGSRKILMVLRKNAPIVSVTVGDLSSYAGASDPPPQTITGSTPPSITFGMAFNKVTSTVTSTFTPTPSGTITNNSARVYYILFDRGDTPVSATVDMADQESNNCLIGFYLNFT